MLRRARSAKPNGAKSVSLFFFVSRPRSRKRDSRAKLRDVLALLKELKNHDDDDDGSSPFVLVCPQREEENESPPESASLKTSSNW